MANAPNRVAVVRDLPISKAREARAYLHERGIDSIIVRDSGVTLKILVPQDRSDRQVEELASLAHGYWPSASYSLES